MTNKQKQDLETIVFFMPEICKSVEITDNDINMFFEYSEQGKHKDKVGTWSLGKQWQTGFNALCEGKKWRGIHIHELYEKGVLDGSMPYFVLLGGCDDKAMSRSVVDFLKKEMFKGADAEVIENCYKTLMV